MVEDRFAGDVAARYDDTLGEMGADDVVGRTVEFLAQLTSEAPPSST